MACHDTSALRVLSVWFRCAVVVMVALCGWSVILIGSPAHAGGADQALVGDPVLNDAPIAYKYGSKVLRAGPAAGPASTSVDAAAGTVTVVVGDSVRPATVTMAWPARVGSWPLALDGADREQHASVTRGADSCTFTNGTLTITSSVVGPNGGVGVLSADLRGACQLTAGGMEQVASIRIGDPSDPVAMPRATPASVDAGVVTGNDFRRDITVTNEGLTSWTISNLGMASMNTWSPSISIDPSTTTCAAGTVLASGDQCNVGLRLLSAPNGWYAEQLVVLGTGKAALVVPVHMESHAPVPAPTGVVSHPGRLGTLITWDPPTTNPSDGYRVYDVAGGARTLVAKAPAVATSTVVPGTGVRHLVLVATTNRQYAESSDVAVDVEDVVTSEVIAQQSYGSPMVFPVNLPPGNERTTSLLSGAVDASRQRWVGRPSNAVSVCRIDDESCSIVAGTFKGTGDTQPEEVVWLPGGGIAYFTGDYATRALWVVPADGSTAPRKVADLPWRWNLAAAPSSDEVLALNDFTADRTVERIRLSDGRVNTIPGTSGIDAFTSSDQGILLLERRIDQTSTGGPRETTAIKLDGSAAHVVSLPAGDNRGAVFDPTGTQIAYVHYVSEFDGAVWVAQADGSSAHPISDVSGAWSHLQWSVGDQAAPTVSITDAPFTTPTGELEIMAADPDDPVGSLTAECKVDGQPWIACRPDSASYAVSGLDAGQHVLQVRVTDPSGYQSAIASHTWTVDATAPAAALAAPAAVQFTKNYALNWSGSDAGGSGVGSYELRLRTGATGVGLGPYSSPSSWHALTGQTIGVTSSPGTEQCWSIRASDRAGNVGVWSAERCTVTPLDDRALIASRGWRRLTSTADAYGTDTRSTLRGASLRRNGVAARQIGIVVRTCPTCGALSVTHGHVTLGRISLKSATAKARQVLWLPMQPRTLSGVLVLKSLTARPVVVDGIVVRH